MTPTTGRSCSLSPYGRPVLIMVALLSCICARTEAQAGGDPGPRWQGKPLRDWVKQVYAKGDEHQRLAIRALGEARFVIGADGVAIPVLTELARGPSGMRKLRARSALAEYGPLALAALKDLGPERGMPADHIDTDLIVARIRIGDPDAKALAAQLLTAVDRAFEKGPGDAEMILMQGSELDLRGEFFLVRLAELIQNRRWITGLSIQTAAARMRLVGGAASPLVVADLKSRDVSTRDRAAVTLAWSRTLDEEETLAALKGAKVIDSDWARRESTIAYAVVPHEPVAKVLELLKVRASHPQPAVAAWACAGLARFGPASGSNLAALRTHLRSPTDEARAAAAEGLLHLGAGAADAAEDLGRALADPDLRVRWRAAAWHLLTDREGPELLTELRRGIDGPDDLDRILAFRALERLGPKAASLEDAVEPWAEVPFPVIAAAGRAALTALRGSSEAPR